MPRPRLEERNGLLGKMCTHCEEWKSLDSYHKSAKGLGGRDSRCKYCRSIYQEKHKDEIRIYKQKYWEANKDKYIKRMKIYRNENKRKLSAYKHKYYRENKPKIRKAIRAYRLKNKDRLKAKAREYKENNREKERFWAARRKARERKLVNDFTEIQMEDTLKHFDYKCALTECDIFHWDHVLPLSIGHGGTTEGNMIPLRSDLNESKQDQNIFEWFEANKQRFDLHQEKFEELVCWLAGSNGVSISEYKDYVYWCHENPHCVEDLLED